MSAAVVVNRVAASAACSADGGRGVDVDAGDARDTRGAELGGRRSQREGRGVVDGAAR